MSFGEVLKEIRLKNGDTLRSLGEKIDNNFSYLNRIEKEEVPISKEVFEKIVNHYYNDKEKLIKAYCNEMLPPTIKKYFFWD